MRLFIAFLLTTLSLTSVAQSYCPPLYGKLGNVSRYHITAGYGLTKLYGDIQENVGTGSAAYLQFDYLLKKGLLIGIEGRFGSLITDSERYGENRHSRNEFKSFGFVFTFHPVAFFNGESYTVPSLMGTMAEALFVDFGWHRLSNHYQDIYRNPAAPDSYGPIDSYDENGDPIFSTKSKSTVFPSLSFGFAIPLNKGYNIKGRYISIVPKMQLNFGVDDKIDGYTPYGWNGRPNDSKGDMYNYYSLGVRYSF